MSCNVRIVRIDVSILDGLLIGIDHIREEGASQEDEYAYLLRCMFHETNNKWNLRSYWAFRDLKRDWPSSGLDYYGWDLKHSGTDDLNPVHAPREDVKIFKAWWKENKIGLRSGKLGEETLIKLKQGLEQKGHELREETDLY